MIEQLPNLVKSVGYKQAKHLSTDISSDMGLYNAENAMRNLRRRLYKETQENPLWMWPEGSSNWPAIQNHHEEKEKEFKNISLQEITFPLLIWFCVSLRLRIFYHNCEFLSTWTPKYGKNGNNLLPSNKYPKKNDDVENFSRMIKTFSGTGDKIYVYKLHHSALRCSSRERDLLLSSDFMSL